MVSRNIMVAVQNFGRYPTYIGTVERTINGAMLSQLPKRERVG